VIIRQAKLDDLEKLTPLLEEFCKESLNEYTGFFDTEHFSKLFLSYKDNTLLAEVDDKVVGMLSGLVVCSAINPEKLYQEVVWYVSKPYRKYGIKLIKALEDKCHKEGIRAIVMGAMQNSKAEALEKFYLKSGYKLFEKQYMKELGG